MKAKNTLVGLTLLLGMAVVVRAQETFRTNINPALIYYRADLLAPRWDAGDRDYIFTNNWHARPMDQRVGDLVSTYKHEFELLHQASLSKVACDWGIDETPGPNTLLPGLSRWKQAGQVARLRAGWELQHGNAVEAREDLLSAFILGRNVSREGYLVSALVQFAIENEVCLAVAENYFRIPTETSQELVAGMEAAPARGRVAQALTKESFNFPDWLLRQIELKRKQHPGDDSKVFNDMIEALDRFTDAQAQTNAPRKTLAEIKKDLGGNVDGMVKLIKDLALVRQKNAQVSVLPYPEFEKQAAQLNTEIKASSNPLVRLFLPASTKSRPKEEAMVVKLAMVRAASEYKLNGEAGAKTVLDPAGNAPFEIQPFIFQGERRGIKFTSVFKGRGWPETLIFVEKDGPPFLGL
jgi:hypothetical protein